MNHLHKIAVIGCGMTATSFIQAATQKNLAAEYGLIDIFTDIRDGNILDFEDCIDSTTKGFKVGSIEYQDLKNYNCLVITAGRPQKPGETRLNMVQDNIAIMNSIADAVKSSGFNGLTVIISNPVDIMTYAYLKRTGFNKKLVIGSGTILDTARLKYSLAKSLNVATSAINGCYVIGEHGDSSFVTWSNLRIGGANIKQFNCLYNDDNYEELLEATVAKKAYEIIKRKKFTCFGIGSNITKIISAYLHDSREVLVVGAYMEGEYGYNDVVFGSPAIIGSNGIEKVLEIPLNKKETQKMHHSISIIKKYINNYFN